MTANGLTNQKLNPPIAGINTTASHHEAASQILPRAQSRYMGYVMVGILCLGQMLSYFDRSVTGLAAVEIMRDLTLTPADYGLLASAFYSFYAITGVVVGLTVSRKTRPRVLLAWLMAIWVLTQIPVVVAPSLMVLIVSRAMLGAAESPSIATSVGAAHEWFGADRRSVPTACVMIGPLLGSVVAPPILISVMAAHGWRAGFLVCAILGAAVLIVLLAVGRNGPDSAMAAPSPRTPSAQSVKSGLWLWVDPTLLAITGAGFSAYWIIAFSVSWLFPMLRLGLGYAEQQAGWIVSGVYLLSALFLLASSWLSQTLLTRGLPSRRAVVWPVVGYLFVGSVAFLGAAIVTDNALRLTLLAIGTGLMLPVSGAVPVLISEIAPLHHRNQMLVVIMALTTLSGMVAPYVTGRLVGNRGLPGYLSAIEICAAVVFLGAILAFLFLHPAAAAQRFQTQLPQRFGDHQRETA